MESPYAEMCEAIRKGDYATLNNILKQTGGDVDFGRVVEPRTGLTLWGKVHGKPVRFWEGISSQRIVKYFIDVWKVNPNTPIRTKKGRTDISWCQALHESLKYEDNLTARVLLNHPSVDVNIKANVFYDIVPVQFLTGEPKCRISIFQWAQSEWHSLEEPLVYIMSACSTIDKNDVRDFIAWLDGNLTFFNSKRTTWAQELSNICRAYLETPRRISHQLSMRLLIKENLAANLFALIIFLMEELITTRVLVPIPRVGKQPKLFSVLETNAVRFFKICQRIPMELQQLICNRAYDLGEDIIPTSLSEPAFYEAAHNFKD